MIRLLLLTISFFFYILIVCAQDDPKLSSPVYLNTGKKAISMAGNFSDKARAERQKGHYLGAFNYYMAALRILKDNKDSSEQILVFSYKIHHEVLAMADTLLNEYNNVGSRIVLSRFLFPIYENSINLGYQLYCFTHSLTYLDESFLLVEKSRNLMLVEALKNARIKSFNGVPEEFLTKQKQLNSGIFILRNLLDSECAKRKPDASLVQKYTDSLTCFQQQSDSFNYFFQKSYPDYYLLLHRNKFVGAADIQQGLSNSCGAVLEYYCGDSNIFLFIFTPEGRFFESFPHNATFEKQVVNFQKALTSSNSEQFGELAYNLCKLIFIPAEKHLINCTNVRVIPDGIIGYIPFECLLKTPAIPFLSYDKMDYLIFHYCFSYSPSSTLLFENINKRNQSANHQMIAFAPGFSQEMKNSYINGCSGAKDSLFLALPEQRWSLRFVEQIRQSFEGNWYTDSSATAARFKNDAGNFGIVHIASHSIFDEQNPMNSRIIFAKSNSDTTASNGYIYAYDLYGMKLNSSLTVLGSCRTGSGAIRRGEGMISLSYAFSYAGCPSIVYSLWEVDEKETSRLMLLFYEGIHKGLSKDQALHEAKLIMLNESNNLTANPFYWAGFVVSGDTVPIMKRKNETDYIFLLAFGGIGLLGFVVFLMLKNKNKR